MLVSVAGAFLAVFVPRFTSVLRTSKTGEAASELARLHRAVAAYYGARHPAGTGCFPRPAGPTPAEGSTSPEEVVFAEDPESGASWGALGYEPERAVRFRYSFVPVAEGCDVHGRDLVTLRAEGDLDGDGKYSVYERVAGEGEDGELIPVGILFVDRPFE